VAHAADRRGHRHLSALCRVWLPEPRAGLLRPAARARYVPPARPPARWPCQPALNTGLSVRVDVRSAGQWSVPSGVTDVLNYSTPVVQVRAAPAPASQGISLGALAGHCRAERQAHGRRRAHHGAWRRRVAFCRSADARTPLRIRWSAQTSSARPQCSSVDARRLRHGSLRTSLMQRARRRELVRHQRLDR
jgi:hypothetical protein